MLYKYTERKKDEKSQVMLTIALSEGKFALLTQAIIWFSLIIQLVKLTGELGCEGNVQRSWASLYITMSCQVFHLEIT